MELRWIAGVSASCFHAVRASIEGRKLADLEVAAAIAEPGTAFALEFAPLLEETPLLRNLAVLSCGIHNNRELASVALAKAVGREKAELLTPALVRHLNSLELAFGRGRSNLIEELEHRSRPIRQQWEARGPGLLAQIARLIEPDVLVERAEVVLVHPAIGGDAKSYWANNTVVLEAVLANPHDDLPETARLGWALAQLNLDLPRFTENLPPARRDRIGPLAMVPVTLAAAESVELARCDPATVGRTLVAWNLASVSAEELTPKLVTWWQTYLESRPSWSVALAALDHMLGE